MWGFYSRKNMSDNPKLWRYMDLTKFLETIIHQKLYFNRSDNFEEALLHKDLKGSTLLI